MEYNTREREATRAEDGNRGSNVTHNIQAELLEQTDHSFTLKATATRTQVSKTCTTLGKTH